MKENDIRPADLIAELERLHREDLKEFFSDQSQFEKVSCPACNSNRYYDKFQKSGFNLCLCEACKTLFVNPRPSPDALFKFYNESKSIAYWSECIFPKTERSRISRIFKPRARLVKKIMNQYLDIPGNLLEIGPGYGFFLEEMRFLNAAKDYLAIEPSHKAAEKCRQRGFTVWEVTMENMRRNVKVDCLVSFEVIEHVFNPREFIQSCADILEPNGILIITTPNIDGFDLAILGPLSDNMRVPNHLNYFNPYSFRDLLIEEGFDVVKLLTPGVLDVEIVRNKIMSGVLDESEIPFLGTLIKDNQKGFNEKFQKFLKGNGLSSSMMVIARKMQ